MIEKINEHIYRIEIPLPENPLRYLNSYLVHTEERSLLIDTGFNRPECREALFAGLDEIGADRNRLDVLLTHAHTDHTGLVSSVVGPGSRVYMHPVDKFIFEKMRDAQSTHWHIMDEKLIQEGYPKEDLLRSNAKHPGRNYVADSDVETIDANDGDWLCLGGLQLQFIHTPGHTPGHVCLYDYERQIMFTGDHLLFDITPNITYWTALEDSLGSYLTSLNRVHNIPVKLALTAHRKNEGDFKARVEELQAHHAARLADTEAIVKAEPGLTAYDIAGRMQWAIRSKNWEEFPPAQKWFAVGEAIAHLVHLANTGRIQRTEVEGVFQYS